MVQRSLIYHDRIKPARHFGSEMLCVPSDAGTVSATERDVLLRIKSNHKILSAQKFATSMRRRYCSGCDAASTSTTIYLRCEQSTRRGRPAAATQRQRCSHSISQQ
ncbi:unnamed protein product [Chrysodeixis includens]|uniref:Uncharacterized protein n=1 Tax=Chrysodeixis includens TaxID=689277 RepID=A0A9N8KX81_CHRIL|nr:unnamed protein product [Chrysodeixis includens]